MYTVLNQAKEALYKIFGKYIQFTVIQKGAKVTFAVVTSKITNDYINIPHSQIEYKFSAGRFSLTFNNVCLQTKKLNDEISHLHLPFQVDEVYLKSVTLDINLFDLSDFFNITISDLDITLNMMNPNKPDEFPADTDKFENEATNKAEEECQFVLILKQIYQSFFHNIVLNIKNIHVKFKFVNNNSNLGIAIDVSAHDFVFSQSNKKIGEKEDLTEPLFVNKTLEFFNLEFSIQEFILNPNKIINDFEVDNELTVKKPQPIPFCKIFGKQELILTIRKDTSFGPKNELTLNINNVYIFVTPMQISLGKCAIDNFCSESIIKPNDMNDSCQGPMTESDHQKVNHEILKEQVACIQANNSYFLETWSCPPGYNSSSNILDISKYSESGCCSFYSVKSDTDEKKFDVSDTASQNKSILVQVNIGAINAILLYEDILLRSDNELSVFKDNSITDLINRANEYFDQAKDYNMTSISHKALSEARVNLLQLCSLNHFMLFIVPFNLKLQNSCSDSKFSCVQEISFGCIDLYENLQHDNYQTNVICIKQSTDSSDVVSPSQHLILKQSGSIAHISKQQCLLESNFSATIDHCTVRLDFTIIKRLLILSELFDNSVLNYSSAIPSEINITNSNVKPISINISIIAKKLSCIVQFPIPDISNNCEMKFSFKPKLRKEVVQVDFEGLNCQTTYNSNSLTCKASLDSLRGFFQEKSDYVHIPILNITKKENQKIEVAFTLNAPNKDKAYNFGNKKHADPQLKIFNPKTVISQCQGEKSIKKELQLPGAARYVKEVFNKNKDNTTIQLKIVIPYAQASLPNKHIIEVLYNRFLLDLFVWFTEELPKCFQSKVSKKPEYMHSDSSNKSQTEHTKLTNANVDKPSLFSIEVSLVEGSISIRTPYKKNNKVYVGKHGEIILTFSNTLLLLTNTFHDHKSRTYFYIDSEDVVMYHQPNCSTKSTHSLLEDFDISRLDKILFPTENGFDLKEVNKEPRGSCLLLSMEVSFDFLRNICGTVLSCGLFGVTLNYKMYPQETMWYNQLADVFKIEYVAINGYKYPYEITEVSLYVSDCLVAYNPLHLSMKTMISLSSLWISLTSCTTSNMLATHMFLEDSGIFLSKNMTKEISNEDFVCVLHLGYFELCHSGSNNENSQLTVCNSDIHIRICSDSCIALMELIIYLTTEGDFIKEVKENKIVAKIPHSATERVKVNSVNAQEYMQEQLADALHDYGPSVSSGSKNLKRTNNVKDMSFPKRQNDDEYSSDDDIDFIYDSEFCIITSDLGTALKGRSELSDIISDPESVGFQKMGEKCEDVRNRKKKKVMDDDEERELDEDEKKEVEKVRNKLCVIDGEKIDSSIPQYHMVAVVKEMTIILHIYGGKDFSKNNPVNSKILTVNKDIDHLKKQEYKNPPTDYTSTKSREHLYFCEKGGKYRNHDHTMEVKVERFRLEYEYFSTDLKLSSAINLLIRNVEVIDRIKESNIFKFLHEDPQYAYQSSTNSYMMKLQSKSSKEELAELAETNIIVSVRPLRVNVDQHAMVLLNIFGTDLIINDSAEVGRVEKHSTPIGEKPTLTIYVAGQQQNNVNCDKNKEQDEIYIRQFTFHPALSIVVDYNSGGVLNATYGSFAGLFLGYASLTQSEVFLKSLHYNGIFGYGNLFTLIANDWFDDIRRNQITGIVGGVGPIKAFMELFSGVRDLVIMPLEQYKEDGRLFTGIKRGTSSFATSSAHATLDLTEKFLGCVQYLAGMVHDMLSSGPRDRQQFLLATPPQDMRDGLNTALVIMSDGLGSTANAIYQTAVEEHSYKGLSGAVGGVMRQVPPALMSPIILASEATCTVIGGLKNQINPVERRAAICKWKKRDCDRNL